MELANVTPHPDALIADLAAGQHGLVTRKQLLAAGVRPATITSRVSTKRLQPVHRGVYQVGPLEPSHLGERAAVLACGPGALVSHRSAAALWTMLPRRNEADPVDITLPEGDRGRREGIRPHRVTALDPQEAGEVEGIPVTMPARTLLDLAGVAGPHELERAIARAEKLELTSRGEVLALLDRRANRRGARTLRSLLDPRVRPALTRSEAEERFLALVRKARLPEPEVNVVVGRYEVDFLWRDVRLAVEIDGYAFHSSKKMFEGDRRRDADLAAHGFQVIRFTWHQVDDEREATLARLAQALGAR